MKSRIDAKNKRLVYQRLLMPKRLRFEDIRSVSLSRVPLSLFDEIGLVARADDGPEFWVHETDGGWGELVSFLQLDTRLPEPWYSRVEAGTRFEIDLKRG